MRREKPRCYALPINATLGIIVMHIHILGVCGTFMGGLAQIAKQLGHKVTGSDANVYPPMSDQLIAAGIELIEGFDPKQLDSKPDLVVIGCLLYTSPSQRDRG